MKNNKIPWFPLLHKQARFFSQCYGIFKTGSAGVMEVRVWLKNPPQWWIKYLLLVLHHINIHSSKKMTFCISAHLPVSAIFPPLPAMVTFHASTNKWLPNQYFQWKKIKIISPQLVNILWSLQVYIDKKVCYLSAIIKS